MVVYGVCIDYRALNKIAAPDPHEMLLIDEMLDNLAEAQFMSKMDLNKTLYQVRVKEAVQPKQLSLPRMEYMSTYVCLSELGMAHLYFRD